MKSYELDVGDEFRITLNEYNPGSDKLLICFSEQAGGMNPTGFGSKPCQKYGWNQIYVGKASHTRYRTLSIERFRDAVAPVLNGFDVMCYGTSLGGYGALYYGGSIDARILSASPRMPGHPLSSNETLVDGDFAHRLHLRDVPLSRHTPYVVYDNRQNQDHRMVQRWLKPAYPEARIINIPRSGHESLQRLSRYGTLSRMLCAFVEGAEITRDTLRAAEGTLDRKVDDAFDAFEDRRYDLAADLFDAIAAELPDAHSVGIYAASVTRCGDEERRRRFRSHFDRGVLSVNGLRGPNRKFAVEALRTDAK